MKRSNMFLVWCSHVGKGITLRISIALLLAVQTLPFVLPSPAHAEGSRDLVENGGARALTEWRTSLYGNLLRRRTFLQVYARAGEVINMGSSAVGVGSGDIVLYLPDSFSSFSETQAYPLPAPDFVCSTAQPGKGVLNTRAKELAGPLPATGGYDPCVYSVISTGVYWVAFYGPSGPDSDANGSNPGSINSPNVSATQLTGVTLWDITVRSSLISTIDIEGRVFTDYLAAFTTGNGAAYRVLSRLFAVTDDGFRYQVDLRGLDPNGFIIYGNTLGFLNPDGETPLYHDLYDGLDNQLRAPQGGVQLAPPSAFLFFNTPAGDLPSSWLPTPVTPSINNVSFSGSAGGAAGYYSQGGDFTYTGNVGGIAEVVVSRDGVDFDPTLPANRVLRSEELGGTQSLHWDGLANDGTGFPVGGPYAYRVSLHSGEYHFPLLDSENSMLGGPTITLLNPPGGTCPHAGNCNAAFYDDRGYRTTSGAVVGTVNLTLPGTNPPSTNVSNWSTGFDSSSAQRAYGNDSSTGFGDKKGLDLWTYFPSNMINSTLTVVDPLPSSPDLHILKEHSGDFQIGATGVFNLIVSNVGTAAFTGLVTVADTLPTGLSPTNASGSGWNCDITDQDVTCTITPSPDLAVGASLTPIQLSVLPSADAAPSTSNTATVSGSGDSNSANDSSTDFVNVNAVDYGDLPAVFNNTLNADNGARHQIGSLHLGPSVTPKGDGQESLAADADLSDDGVDLAGGERWLPSSTVHLNVYVTGTGGYLAGWFDWNNDNDFNDLNEEIIFGSVSSGGQSIPLSIPSSYTTGQTIYSRFRLYNGNPGGPSPVGMAMDGEVEDYAWSFTPTAVTVLQFRQGMPMSNSLPLIVVAALLAVLAFLALLAYAQRGRQPSE